MGIIQKSFEITKTIKNIGRLREIVTVLAKNGFEELITKSGLHTKIPNFVFPTSKSRKELQNKEGFDINRKVGYMLRKSFEELGPGFVKLGQVLATRDDLFDSSFIREMIHLQDQVKPIPFSDAMSELDKSLQISHKDLFEFIDEKPIGTASIGVVYQGKLSNGQDVVVKIRRPGVLKSLPQDVEILSFIVKQIEKVSDDLKYLNLSKTIHDLGRSLTYELDFNREAINCRRLGIILEKYDQNNLIHLPKIYQDYTSSSVLVMEKLVGIPFNNKKLINEKIDVIIPIIEDVLTALLKAMLIDGFFHADLHGGNIFLLENKVGLLDFGSCGILSQRNTSVLVVMLHSLLNGQYENFVDELLDIADYDDLPDVNVLIQDVKDELVPYLGLSQRDIDTKLLFRAVMSALMRHRIYLPREWILVLRGITTLDGVGKSLECDVDIFGVAAKNLGGIVKEFLSKERLINEAFFLSRGFVSLLRMAPRHLKSFSKELRKQKYSVKFILTGHEKGVALVVKALFFLGFSFLSGMFFLGGVLLLRGQTSYSFAEIPEIVWLCWGLSLASLIGAVSVRNGEK